MIIENIKWDLRIISYSISKFGWDPNWFCFKLSYDMIHKFERFKFKITRYDLNLNWESNLKSVTNLILYICMPRVEKWWETEENNKSFIPLSLHR